jgi:hypothetical protein
VPGSPLPPGIAAAGAVPTELFAAPQLLPTTATGIPTNATAGYPPGANMPAPMGPPANAAPPQATATVATGQATAAPVVVQPTATANIALSSNAPPAASASPVTFVRSARLSELVTRVAQSRNLLAGQGINVYVSNHVAVLQGTVRSADDGATLANVVNLEPNIWHVENRLTAARPAATGSGAAPTGP